ncbi:hypothetical protein V5O48_012354 [Marasmius crinis-equi]|uniref:Uncharacterized protein n=1 Tax=Marasmius crinis-equi TaxID=585013 RepID=A0ABR3F310_9AGAR
MPLPRSQSLSNPDKCCKRLELIRISNYSSALSSSNAGSTSSPFDNLALRHEVSGKSPDTGWTGSCCRAEPSFGYFSGRIGGSLLRKVQGFKGFPSFDSRRMFQSKTDIAAGLGTTIEEAYVLQRDLDRSVTTY